jgi:hypothetical protein
MELTEIRSALDQIRSLATEIAAIPEDHRIVAYRSVDPLFLKLEGHLREHPDGAASRLLDEIRLIVIIMARLDDANGEPDAVNLQRLGSLVDELGKTLCR